MQYRPEWQTDSGAFAPFKEDGGHAGEFIIDFDTFEEAHKYILDYSKRTYRPARVIVIHSVTIKVQKIEEWKLDQ